MTEVDPLEGLVRRLARKVSDLEQQVYDQGRAQQAADRSIEDGGTQELYDEDDELRAVVGAQPDGSYTVTTYGGPVPPAPSAPLVATFPGGATITWDGYDENDEQGWPENLARVAVYLSTVPGEPATDDTLVASIEGARGGAISVAQPSDVTTYCTLVAITAAGVASAQSLEVAVTGGAIPEGGDGASYPFYAPEPPLGLTMADAGRQWFDTNAGNKPYVWDGDTWEARPFGADATEEGLLAGKRVPLDTAATLEWGVPNPQAAPTLAESWELLSKGNTWPGTGYGGGLVLDGGVYYSVSARSTTFTTAAGVTKPAFLFTLHGSNGTSATLFTHVNNSYAVVGPMGVSLAKIGSEWVVTWGVFVDTDRAATYCRRFSASTLLQVGSQWKLDTASHYPLAATAAGSSLLLLRYDAATSQYRVETRAVGDGALSATTLLSAASMGGAPPSGAFSYGWSLLRGAYDYGATRTLIATHLGVVRSFNGTAVQAAEQFTITGSYSSDTYLTWDGSRFVAGVAGSILRRSTGNTSSGTVWAAYAHEHAASGTTTAASPVSATGRAVGIRSGLLLPASTMPPDTDEDPSPDFTQVYAFTQAGAPALATLREVVTTTITEPDGTSRPFVATPHNRLAVVPPTVSTFPSGTAGVIESELGGVIVRGDGTGDWPALRRMIEAAHRTIFATTGHTHSEYAPAASIGKLEGLVDYLEKRVQTGSVSTGTLVAGTPTTVTATFPFEYASAPNVTALIVSGAGNPDNFSVVRESVTTTQVVFRVVRTSGTASLTVEWVSVGDPA